MQVRKSTYDDAKRIAEIIGQAQRDLHRRGIDQWQNGYPNAEVIAADIAADHSYVVEAADGTIVGTAVISFDGEPTYAAIYDGEWLDDSTYAVIHRIAVADCAKCCGVASLIEQYTRQLCLARGIDDIRIDTHRDNTPMQRFLAKRGYQLCGTILLQSGDSRLAYHRRLPSNE